MPQHACWVLVADPHLEAVVGLLPPNLPTAQVQPKSVRPEHRKLVHQGRDGQHGNGKVSWRVLALVHGVKFMEVVGRDVTPHSHLATPVLH